MRPALLVLAATSFTLSTSRPADACSPPPCWGGAFVPGNHGRVPANAPALFWRPMFVYDDLTSHPMNVVLTSAADPTTPIPLTAPATGGCSTGAGAGSWLGLALLALVRPAQRRSAARAAARDRRRDAR